MRRALLALVASVFASPVLTLGGGEASLPGMPPVLDSHDVYAAARPGEMSPAVRGVVSRIYVPNSRTASVDVIDPATYKIVDHFSVGREPQHVTPSYDLKTLWVLADRGDALTTCTTRRTGATRSWWPSARSASISATRRRWRSSIRCACPAAVSTTWTSPRTAATCSRAASSRATWSRSTWPSRRCSTCSRCRAAPCRRT